MLQSNVMVLYNWRRYRLFLEGIHLRHGAPSSLRIRSRHNAPTENNENKKYLVYRNSAMLVVCSLICSLSSWLDWWNFSEMEASYCVWTTRRNTNTTYCNYWKKTLSQRLLLLFRIGLWLWDCNWPLSYGTDSYITEHSRCVCVCKHYRLWT